MNLMDFNMALRSGSFADEEKWTSYAKSSVQFDEYMLLIQGWKARGMIIKCDMEYTKN